MTVAIRSIAICYHCAISRSVLLTRAEEAFDATLDSVREPSYSPQHSRTREARRVSHQEAR
jgi:hypothetical protein